MKLTNLPESKIKDVWIMSLAYAKSLFKSIFGHQIFICKPIFKMFAAHFRTKGMLTHDKIIFV